MYQSSCPHSVLVLPLLSCSMTACDDMAALPSFPKHLNVSVNADYQEKLQLKEAQRKMDRLAMQSQKQDTEKEEEDEWEPEFEAPKSSEWDNTLEVLDKLQDRLKAATNRHDGKEGPAPVSTTGDSSQPC